MHVIAQNNFPKDLLHRAMFINFLPSWSLAQEQVMNIGETWYKQIAQTLNIEDSAA